MELMKLTQILLALRTVMVDGKDAGHSDVQTDATGSGALLVSSHPFISLVSLS